MHALQTNAETEPTLAISSEETRADTYHQRNTFYQNSSNKDNMLAYFRPSANGLIPREMNSRINVQTKKREDPFGAGFPLIIRGEFLICTQGPFVNEHIFFSF